MNNFPKWMLACLVNVGLVLAHQPQSAGQSIGTGEISSVNCSVNYDGDTVLGADDRTYGVSDMDGSGITKPCIMTTRRLSPINRCINLGADLESAVLPDGTLEDYGYDITPQDLDVVVRAGFDTVRMPIRWSAHTGDAPQFLINAAFFDEVDAAITASLRRGLNVIVDVHHFDEFNLAPDQEEAKLIRIWEQLSRHYKNFDRNLQPSQMTGRRPRIIFELLNEPHFENVGGQLGEPDHARSGIDIDYSKSRGRRSSGIERLNNLNAKLLERIRYYSYADRWVIVGSSQYGSIGPMLGGPNGERFQPPADDRRIITTAHYYDPIRFTHQRQLYGDERPYQDGPWGSAEDIDAIERDFESVASWQSQYGRNYPFLLGEFGTSRDTRGQFGVQNGLPGTPVPERQVYALSVRKAAEAHDFAWCYWDLGSPTFGIFDPETEDYIDGVLENLIPR